MFQVILHPYNEIQLFIKNFVNKISSNEANNTLNGLIWLNQGASFALTSLVPDRSRISEITPVTMMKSIKNQVEIKGNFIVICVII